MEHKQPIYGLMAEFEEPEQLVAAARRAREAGYRRVRAFTPYPVHGLAEALRQNRTWLPIIVLGGGVAGGLAGYLLQFWTMAIDYPLNVGGRPLNSWPAFIPITFETTVLAAALAAVLGMLALNGLPEPYHPVFNLPDFKLASRNRFFLCVESSDALFDGERTRRFLEDLAPLQVGEVPW
jgi:hypothetical protein